MIAEALVWLVIEAVSTAWQGLARWNRRTPTPTPTA